MRRHTSGLPVRAFALTATACLALTLTACGGGNPLSGGGDGGGGDLKAEDSPMSKWYESFVGEQDMSEEAMAKQQMAAEEVIAACMSEQGFEYTPVDYSDMGMVSGGEDELDWGSKEFVEKYGYGYFNSPYNEEAGTDEESSEESVDPNQERVDAMSEAEQEAYYAALYGDMAASDEEGEVAYDPEKAGCQGKSQMESSPEMELWNSEEVQALSDDMMELTDETIPNDPKIKELNGKWAECMADAGYADKDWKKPMDADEWFMNKSNDIWEEVNPGAGDEDFDQDSWVEPNTTDEYKKLAKEEIETAVADFTCREDLNYDQTLLKVQFAAEDAFIAAHKDQMDAIVAKYEELQK